MVEVPVLILLALFFGPLHFLFSWETWDCVCVNALESPQQLAPHENLPKDVGSLRWTEKVNAGPEQGLLDLLISSLQGFLSSIHGQTLR